MSPVVQQVLADVNGDGKPFVIQGWDDGGTTVADNQADAENRIYVWKTNGNVPGPGPANPAGSGWRRNSIDLFFAAKVDDPFRQDVVLVNLNDGWIGALKWEGSLVYVAGSGPPISGPGNAFPAASGWHVGQNDQMLMVDVDNDGLDEILVWNNADLWTGIFKWDLPSLSYVWGSPSPIPGPEGNWPRSQTDKFTIAPVPGPGINALGSILVTGRAGTAELAWEGGALVTRVVDPVP